MPACYSPNSIGGTALLFFDKLMKRQLQLFGDRTKAAKFIRFADRKLGEMKNQMRLQRLKMMNRLIRFATDNIEVYIESYHGFDKIRIRAAKRKGCFPFTGLPLSVSELDLVNFTQDNANSFLITNKWHLWDFGDGAFHQHERVADYSKNHDYPAAGLYTVKRAVSPNVIINDISSTAMTNKSWIQKASTFQGSEANAWANYITQPWVSSSFREAAHFLFVFSPPLTFQYISIKAVFDLDLTGNSDGETLFLAITPRILSEIVRASSIQSSLGGSVNALNLTGAIDTHYNLLNVSSLAETLSAGVEIGDNSGFPQFSGATQSTGWRLRQNNTLDGVFVYRKESVRCEEIRNNYITVT